jgi:hypothetical protein
MPTVVEVRHCSTHVITRILFSIIWHVCFALPVPVGSSGAKGLHSTHHII